MCVERRLADVVDEGQAAGLIAEREGSVRNPDSKTFAELGLKKQRLAESRRIRDHYTDDGLLALHLANETERQTTA